MITLGEMLSSKEMKVTESSSIPWSAKVEVDPESHRVLLIGGPGNESPSDLLSFTLKGAFDFAAALEMLSVIAQREKGSGIILLVGGSLIVMKRERALTLAKELRESALMIIPAEEREGRVS